MIFFPKISFQMAGAICNYEPAGAHQTDLVAADQQVSYCHAQIEDFKTQLSGVAAHLRTAPLSKLKAVP